MVNDGGELLAYQLTPGHVDDRHPLPQVAQGLFGKLIGDKGSLSKAVFESLFAEARRVTHPTEKNYEKPAGHALGQVALAQTGAD